MRNTHQVFHLTVGTLPLSRLCPVPKHQHTIKIYANGKHIYDFKYRWAGTPDKVKRVYVITEKVSQPVQVTQLMVI